MGSESKGFSCSRNSSRTNFGVAGTEFARILLESESQILGWSLSQSQGFGWSLNRSRNNSGGAGVRYARSWVELEQKSQEFWRSKGGKVFCISGVGFGDEKL